MVDRIYELKNQILARLEQEMQERGDRLDATEAGKLVDMVKDLAEAEEKCWEAEYYRSVTESMGQSQGYEQQGYDRPRMNQPMGYTMGRRGYQPDMRR